MAKYWEGTLIRLRGVEPDDAETHLELDQEDDISRFQGVMNPPISRAATHKWAEEAAVARPARFPFVQERRRRRVVFTHGEFSGMIEYGITREEFRERHPDSWRAG